MFLFLKVPDPTHKESTIADSWPSPVDMKNNQKRAPLYTFHNDQEHNPFLQIVGIPEIHVQYVGENTVSSSCLFIKLSKLFIYLLY